MSEPGEIKPKGYEVIWWEMTNFGYQISERKAFKDLKSAKALAKKWLKILRKFAKESDDPEYFEIRRLSDGKIIEKWRNDMGEVVHEKSPMEW